MKKLLLLFLLLPVIASGEETDAVSGLSGGDYLKAGVIFLNAAQYENAASCFTNAYEKLPLLGDYALYYRATAYAKAEGMDEARRRELSAESLTELIEKYSRTPIKRQARAMLIKIRLETDKKAALPLLESYVRDYPDDEEMKFLLAGQLKDRDAQRAGSLFKELYIRAGAFSAESYKELRQSDISTQDIIERSSNLIKAMSYDEAESGLRAALKKDGGGHRADILKTLAHSFFRQKRYKEAAAAYLKAPDLYYAALSFFRAGDSEAFSDTLKKLIAANDARAGRLLVSFAADKRRAGGSDEALKMLAGVRADFPSDAEEALWLTGWTHYLGGDYKKALAVFTELCLSGRNTKYIYWKARAAEKAGEPSENIYSSLEGEYDYYGFLAAKRSGPNEKRLIGAQAKKAVRIPGRASGKNPFKRSDTLAEAGMREDAVKELVYAARELASEEDLIAAALRLKDMGEYNRAIYLISGIPQDSRPLEILYPLAFWPAVKDASREFAVDPYLILSVIREESRYSPDAVSRAGAIGIMQIMPQTGKRLARGLNADFKTGHLYEPGTNIRLGSYYLNSLLKYFGSGPPALAAYNAGENKVTEWLEKGRYDSYDEFVEDIPYRETKEYIKRIMTTYFRYKNGRGAGNDEDREAPSDGADDGKPADPPAGAADPFNLSASYGIIKNEIP
ncbi:MAG: transglycosylase SLT domain-containing protein [Thermodesulfovibrionales bacterium]|nr:transglycosylase SLT domain-containing protein [Thermodesulfovibrionales bacterium]